MYAHTLVAQRAFVLDTIIDVPNPKEGKCYARCLKADSSWLGHFSIQFTPQEKETVKIEVYPAYTYYALRQNAIVEPLEKGEVVKIEPPKYDIVKQIQKIEASKAYWVLTMCSGARLGIDPQYCIVACFVERPSEYSSYSLQKMKESAKIIRLRPDTTLIEVLDSTSQLLIQITVPPQYKTIKRCKNGSKATYRIEADREFRDKMTEWRGVSCETPYGGSSIVRSIQQALNKRGYKLVEDNTIGKATKKAIIDFQKKNGFPIGNLNIETLKALDLTTF